MKFWGSISRFDFESFRTKDEKMARIKSKYLYIDKLKFQVLYFKSGIPQFVSKKANFLLLNIKQIKSFFQNSDDYVENGGFESLLNWWIRRNFESNWNSWITLNNCTFEIIATCFEWLNFLFKFDFHSPLTSKITVSWWIKIIEKD